MNAQWISFCLLVFIGAVDPARNIKKKLPAYVGKGCSRNDPNFNECVVRVGGPAIKSVANGDPEYRIPKLDPFLIKELKVKQGTKQVGLELACIDCKLYGLHNTEFTGARVDWKKRYCEWDLHLDLLRVEGKYNVSGKVLLLPITGSGDMTMNVTDVNFQFIYDWTSEVRSNGIEYAVIGNVSFPFKMNLMTIHLDNLFNGDRLLGDNMNNFLNENWRDIMKDLGPAMSEVFANLAKTVLQNMADQVPFDVMFPKEYPIP